MFMFGYFLIVFGCFYASKYKNWIYEQNKSNLRIESQGE